MALRNTQHTWDVEKLPGKHISDGGKGCLNAHLSAYRESDPCSYRGQAYKKALGDSTKYNYPAYSSLCVQEGDKAPSFFMETLRLLSLITPAPKEGQWDLESESTEGKKNFRDSADVPYWHEAHHIVPNGTLQKAITDVGKGQPMEQEIKLMVRAGLLDEGYNLNDMKNMIILPMDRKVALALGLPRHRQTRWLWSHTSYNNHVFFRLKDFFADMKMTAEKCKDRVPQYRKCKKLLEDLSEELYPAIKEAGKTSQQQGESKALDEMSGSYFTKKVKQTLGSSQDTSF
ncbi:AHH domain-containing protein [Archangium violaceum]|uniref:Uncharacterized protein n=1 Tax=Archangium violaceum Cb vi76 TaxID=1406225 RepID=A0A084T229_9BACT|nr:AHH domain-containing protein [Archangium violaceum]KFA94764.1 hypothetical protein Q664_00910 [Archangium violaceum Cb vi76]